MNTTFYKIRDPKTGLFKSRGAWAKWSKKGDQWTSLGHLKQHLNLLMSYKCKIDSAWELVEYQFEPKETGSISMAHFLDGTTNV